MPVEEKLTCFHCHQDCEDDVLWIADKAFCCYGCKTVFEILQENDLCDFYTLDERPGIQQKNPVASFSYLDEPEVRAKLIRFESKDFVRVEFSIPTIHCVSCIWLLENLHKIDSGVIRTVVNFSAKTAAIDFNPTKISLGELANLISRLGYAPRIALDENPTSKKKVDNLLILKLAIAGFCFGNVMLFSFPEYLGIDASEKTLLTLFTWLNFGLAIPVTFYCGQDYFIAAWKSFKQRQINIDVPLALGIAVLFLRSGWDIISGTGPGYVDSLAGLVFFLLIGRWFQGKTYESLAFDRDYKSYFPLAVLKGTGEEWKSVLVSNLSVGDFIRVRNMEIVPADCVLHDAEGFIDYSFVTGESRAVRIERGEVVYAGGRIIGKPVELKVQKKTSQSHLTSLWGNGIFEKKDERVYARMLDRVAHYFTWIILGIALISAVYWLVVDASQVWLVVSAILIVACPCALAMSAPFTFGNMVRVFGRHGLYLKNPGVIERMAKVDAIVFDKTGTVTHGDADVKIVGEFSVNELGIIKELSSFSTHPLSAMISKSIQQKSAVDIFDYREWPGKGIEGIVDGKRYRLGSASFIAHTTNDSSKASYVYVSIDGEPKGYFQIETNIRSGLPALMMHLKNKFVALLSGDNDADRSRMGSFFSEMQFNQNPHDKLDYIKTLQGKGNTVMMLGDGLNDSGALKQSEVGISVTDDTGIFTPASDGILMGNKVVLLDRFLALSKSATRILKTSFVISFLYNIVGLSFAVTGNLDPIVAAILMPVSSISVVGFATLAVNFSSMNAFKKP